MKLQTPKMTFLLIAWLIFWPGLALSQTDHHDHSAHEDTAVVEEHDEHEGHDEHTDEVTLTSEAIEIFGIKTVAVDVRELNETISVPARVSFNTEAMAHIGTQVQGRAKEIMVRLGDNVKTGDLLLVVDSPLLGMAQSEYIQLHSAVEAAKVDLEAAGTLAEVARTAYERAEKLHDSNGISITEYLERQGNLKRAEADVRRAKADLRVSESARLAAENRLHIYNFRHEDCAELLRSGEISTHYEIHAPIDGQVVEREVTPGEVVEPGDEALLVLANMDELWVLADVPERWISRISPGSTARIAMSALGDTVFQGMVSYIAPQLDPRTRTASVRIVIPADFNPISVVAPMETAHPDHEAMDDHHDHEDHPETESSHAHEDHEGHDDHHDHEGHDEHDGHDDHGDEQPVAPVSHKPAHAGQLLKPGMFGKAELEIETNLLTPSTPVLVVPETAIQDVEGGPGVFVPVEGEPNTYALRPIRIGRRVGRWVPVLSGLNAGEQVVSDNSFLLKAELGKEGASHGHAH